MKANLLNSVFLDACRRQSTERTPVWFMRQAGRYMPEYRKMREKYDLLTLCKTPDLATEVTLQPIKALNVDAAIIFADLLLPLEPMGVPFHFAEGEGPIIEKPIQNENDIEALRKISPKEDLAYVLRALSQVRETLPSHIPLIGFAGAPFTLASYLIEGGHSQHFLKTKKMMLGRPNLWKKLMEKISTMLAEYLIAQIEAGADVVQLFDSWIGSLSPYEYETFVLPYSSSVIKKVQTTSSPVIHFGTGNSAWLPLFAQAGGDVVSVDWRISLATAWKSIGSNFSIQGNLDPALLFAPPEHLKKQVKQILTEALGRPGHIFNLGHGILPETSVDNVKRVVEWVREL